MLKRWTIGLLGLVLLATPAWAQVRLERKVREGVEVKRETVMEVNQKLTIAGMEIDTSANNRTMTKGSTGKRDGAGMLRVSEKIDHLQVSMTVMGQDYSFDSNSPDKAGNSVLEGMLRPVHKAMAGQTTITTFDKDNQITTIEMTPDVLGGLPAEAQQLVRSQLDPANLKRAAQQSLNRIPKSPVTAGDVWRQSEKMDLGGGQVMTLDMEYKYEGVIERDNQKLDKITSKVLAVDLTVDNPQFAFKEPKLKATETTGEILFNREAGAIVSDSNSVRIEGEMTFVINNMDLPAKLDLRMKTSERIVK